MTSGYLLDTNVLSETRKVNADPRVIAFLSNLDGSSLFLSVLTMGELRRGVEAKRRRDPGAVDSLAAWVDSIETTFADRILPVSTAIARLWGEQTATRTLPVIDSLIAATATHHGLILATRNTKDFDAKRVPLLDPWEPAGDRT